MELSAGPHYDMVNVGDIVFDGEMSTQENENKGHAQNYEREER